MRDAAIKILSPGSLDSPEARKGFRNEARILSKFNDPSTQTIYFDSADFATRKTRTLMTLAKGESFGLSISPDGRRAVYPEVDPGAGEIMPVNHFR